MPANVQAWCIVKGKALKSPHFSGFTISNEIAIVHNLFWVNEF